MPEFYSEHNMRRQFNAPNFTRTRHRFRGPRESEKINLEMNQMYTAIQVLHKNHDEFQHRFVESATTLLEGEGLTVEMNEDGPIVLVGLEELASRIDMLRRRVKALEA